MGIEVDWGDASGRILVWTVEGVWRDADYHRAIEATRQLTAHREQPVFLLVDLQLSVRAPSNILTLLRQSLRPRMIPLRQVILIHPTQLYRQLFKTATQTQSASYDIQFAHNAHEAYALLSSAALHPEGKPYDDHSVY